MTTTAFAQTLPRTDLDSDAPQDLGAVRFTDAVFVMEGGVPRLEIDELVDVLHDVQNPPGVRRECTLRAVVPPCLLTLLPARLLRAGAGAVSASVSRHRVVIRKKAYLAVYVYDVDDLDDEHPHAIVLQALAVTHAE